MSGAGAFARPLFIVRRLMDKKDIFVIYGESPAEMAKKLFARGGHRGYHR